MAKGIMYVDNIRVEFDDEATIMDVCRKAGVEMPNFCFHSDLSVYGACRMCMVEDLDTGKIDAAYADSHAKLAALEQKPLSELLASEDGRNKLNALYDSLNVVHRLHEGDLARALGVQLGFNANDGD